VANFNSNHQRKSRVQHKLAHPNNRCHTPPTHHPQRSTGYTSVQHEVPIVCTQPNTRHATTSMKKNKDR
jgi:hypothetical protein